MPKINKHVYLCEACRCETTVTDDGQRPERCPICTSLHIYYDRSYTVGSDDD